jgi:hypothetical protein
MSSTETLEVSILDAFGARWGDLGCEMGPKRLGLETRGATKRMVSYLGRVWGLWRRMTGMRSLGNRADDYLNLGSSKQNILGLL